MARKKTQRERDADDIRLLCDLGLTLIPLYTPNRSGCSCGNHNCHSPGKHPISKGWQNGGITNPDVAVRVLANKNTGVVTGDGIIVIDVDDKNDGGLSLGNLEDANSRLPPTLTVRTGAGWHYYYRTEENVPNSVSMVGDGIDVRSRGGFVVGPPSRHINGKRYTIDASSPRHLAEAPDWFVALAREATRQDNVRESSNTRGQHSAILKGSRNDRLMSIGGMLRKNGLGEKAIFQALMEENRRRCVPPLPEEEVRQIAHSCAKYDGPENLSDWREMLILNKRAEIERVEANCYTILKHGGIFKDCLQYDEFTGKGTWVRQPNTKVFFKPLGPEVNLGQDFVTIQRIIAKEYRVTFTRNVIVDSIQALMRDTSYDSLRTHVEGLKVSEKAKGNLDNWLTVYLGSPKNKYHKLVGRKFLISMVARAMQPGCKADSMLVFESPIQGIGKSTACAILGGDFFDSGPINPKDKDFLMKLRRVWLYEVGELSGLRRNTLEGMKQFLTDTHDTYREPYGRFSVTIPRRCVFIGTTNESHYLADEENRRFWPIEMDGMVKLNELARDRNHLLALARNAYESGEAWWPTQKEQIKIIGPQQMLRQSAAVDPWIDDIQSYIKNRASRRPTDGRIFIYTKEIYACLDIPKEKRTPTVGKRIKRVMYNLGYIHKRRSEGAGYENLPSLNKRAADISKLSTGVVARIPGYDSAEKGEEHIPEGNGGSRDSGENVQGDVDS